MTLAGALAGAFPVMFVMLVMFVIVAVVVMAVVMIAMRRAVARRVFIGVPRLLDKIDVLAAGVISAAVLRPMFCVTRRHAQIDRLLLDVPYRPFDDDRLCVDHTRLREGTDVDAAVEARLADSDRYANVGRQRWRCQSKQARCNNQGFHAVPLLRW